jgi:hypothetical protein
MSHVYEINLLHVPPRTFCSICFRIYVVGGHNVALSLLDRAIVHCVPALCEEKVV